MRVLTASPAHPYVIAPDLVAGELDDGDGGKTPPGDRCLDFECWGRKAALFLTRKDEDLRREHPDLILLNNGEAEGVDFEETFQAEVLNATDVVPSRKSDGIAVPALVVNGAGLGRVRWVQPVHEVGASPGHRRLSGSETGGGEPTEKTPEEKRKPYEKRRRQVVIEAVKARLEALAAECDLSKVADLEGGPMLGSKGLALKTLVLLAVLIDERGWHNHVHDGRPALPEGFSRGDLNALQNHQLGTGESREAALRVCWDLLRLAVGKLAVRLSVAPGEPTNEPHCAEVETLCAMLGFDLPALRGEAAEAVPYAKLWRDQVSDDWVAPAAAE